MLCIKDAQVAHRIGALKFVFALPMQLYTIRLTIDVLLNDLPYMINARTLASKVPPIEIAKPDFSSPNFG